MKHHSSDLISKTVITNSGSVIGEIHDYLVDVETWAVTDLKIKIERKKAKELNLKVSIFKLGAMLVLVDVSHVHSVADQVILNMEAEAFADYISKREHGDQPDPPKEAAPEAEPS